MGPLGRVDAPDLNWYRALYRRAGAPWLWFSRLEMSDQQLAAVSNSPTNELFVAEGAGSEVGMAELDRSQPPDVEITFFGLFPEAIGKRLGRPLMTAVLERMGSLGGGAFGCTPPRFGRSGRAVLLHKMRIRSYKQAIEVADDPRIRGILPEDTAPHVPIIR